MIVLFMICALVIGLLHGMSGIDFTFLNIISENTDLVLYILMFSVGISIGMQNFYYSNRNYYWFFLRWSDLLPDFKNAYWVWYCYHQWFRLV